MNIHYLGWILAVIGWIYYFMENRKVMMLQGAYTDLYSLLVAFERNIKPLPPLTDIEDSLKDPRQEDGHR